MGVIISPDQKEITQACRETETYLYTLLVIDTQKITEVLLGYGYKAG